jgi:4-carboxymuconolactone decarboxylase
MRKILGVIFMSAILTTTVSAGSYLDELKKTDPEFAQFFAAFSQNEVVNENGVRLDEKTRHIAILAAMLGRGAVDFYPEMLAESLDSGVTPVEAREILYQAVAYCGIGRIYPFFKATNYVFKKKKIRIPLAGQSTTTPETRLQKGAEKQVEIFGDGMRDFYKKGYMNRWLADNCFGDYYTRTGLTVQQRELVTFCYIAADGTNEAQLRAHINGNNLVGNNKEFLISVASQIMPYIGYPRTLNIIAAVNETLGDKK